MAMNVDERQAALESGSLQGTMNERSIPEQQDQLTQFKDVLRNVSLAATAKTRPTLGNELGRYEKAGVKLTTPSAIQGGLEAGILGRREVQQNTFAGVTDLLKAQEAKLQQAQQANMDFASKFTSMLTSNPAMFSLVTGADLDSIKRGVVPTELIAKISQLPPEEPKRETSVQEVGGRQLLIDTQTGETIRDLGAATGLSTGIDLNSLLSISDAKSLGVPYGTTQGEAINMGLTPGQVTSEEDQTTKKQASSLVDSLLASSGLSGAVGFPSIASALNLPGTPAADFKAQFASLQAILSLENISKLKGTGAISDKEGALLSAAASSLSLSMTEDAFKKELLKVKEALSGTTANQEPPDEAWFGRAQDVLKKKTFSDGSAISSSDISELIQRAKEYAAAGHGTDDTMQYINTALGFKPVGGDTNQATKKLTGNFPVGSSGGQCGRFVNNLTGIGMGDSYANKMSFTSSLIGPTKKEKPEAGDVFIMPYKDTGHTGIITDVIPKDDGTYDYMVVDSNYHLNEKVDAHVINSSKVSGYIRPEYKKQYADIFA